MGDRATAVAEHQEGEDMRLVIALGIACALAAGTAQAGTRRINTRENRQQERIRSGVRSGELTRAETARLEAEQAAIRVREAAYTSDGVVTPAERRRLNRALNRSNRRIARNTHDAQDRD
jgi:hypothetical protein